MAGKSFTFTFSILFFVLLQQSSFASPSPALPAATKFFRSRQSTFPSGQASRSELLESLQRTEFELFYDIQWQGSTFQVPGNNLYLDKHFSKTLTTQRGSLLLLNKKADSKELASLESGQQVQLLSTDSYWAKVMDPKSKKIGFMPLHHLTTIWNDSGVYINLHEMDLHQGANEHSPILAKIPQQTRCEALEIINGWMRIQFLNWKGYVDLNGFVGRADLATQGHILKKGWVRIIGRNGSWIVTEKGEKFHLSQVNAFITNPRLAILKDSLEDNSLPLKSRALPKLKSLVTLKTKLAKSWGVSLLPLHGEIYWLKSDYEELQNSEGLFETSSQKNPKLALDFILTDELYQRKIQFFAIHPDAKNPKTQLQALASANGIFKTLDGIHWQKISTFGNVDYPLSIHADGSWFVGPFKSTDQGKTFESFVKWDQLTKSLQVAKNNKTNPILFSNLKPQFLRLTHIEIPSHNKIQFQIDLGNYAATFESPLEFSNFQLVKISDWHSLR